MGVTDRLKHQLRNWLQIEEIQSFNAKIINELDFVTNAAKNEIWYRGETNEIEQFYSALTTARPADRMKFWGAASTKGNEIQKRHTGVPGLIVDVLTDIVLADLYDIEFTKGNSESIWLDIAKENKFEKLLRKAVKEALYMGDGAFKYSLDASISELPIIEWWKASDFDVRLRRGRLDEIIFKSIYRVEMREYELHETYGFGYVKYNLYQNEKEVPLDTVPMLAELTNVVFDGGELDEDGNVIKRGGHMMAVLMAFGDSERWPGRGRSIYDRKIDNFDSLDESWSQWMDALRAGRTKTYIPTSLIPRDTEGKMLKPNPFDNRFMAVADNITEGAQNKVQTESPTIPHDAYLATYVTALDLCLQGIISPSTLGIDTKKLDNAEAQREKEKATLYTRNKIVDMLTEALVDVVEVALKTAADSNNTAYEDVEINVNFGEYANPSFESQIETVGKGKTQGILSTEAAVEELYGDSRDDDWKKEEVARLKQEQGIMETDEPAVNIEYDDPNDGII